MKTFYAQPKITLLLLEATDVIRTSGIISTGDGNNDFSDPFDAI